MSIQEIDFKPAKLNPNGAMSTVIEELGHATNIIDRLNGELSSGAMLNTPELSQAVSDLSQVVCAIHVRVIEGREPESPMIIEERDL